MTFYPFRTLSTALVLVLVAGSAMAQDGMTTPGYGGGMAANTEVRLSAVEDQMRALTGKVEQIDYILRRMDQALQRMQADTDARLTKLENAPAPTQARTALPQQQPADAEGMPDNAAAVAEQSAVEGTLGSMKVRDGRVTGGTVNPKQPPLPSKPADYGLTAQELYDRAFGLLRQANYEEAATSFEAFIDKYPQEKLIDNAKYWYAETFYVRGKFADAAVAFAEAYQQNPKGNKAPDSLLKLAMSLAGVEKAADACNTLDALKAKYPNAASSIRIRADQERARLKCK